MVNVQFFDHESLSIFRGDDFHKRGTSFHESTEKKENIHKISGGCMYVMAAGM